MNTLRKYVCVFLLLSSVAAPVFADTSQQELYVNSLRQLISLLQQQVAVLVAQLQKIQSEQSVNYIPNNTVAISTDSTTNSTNTQVNTISNLKVYSITLYNDSIYLKTNFILQVRSISLNIKQSSTGFQKTYQLPIAEIQEASLNQANDDAHSEYYIYRLTFSTNISDLGKKDSSFVEGETTMTLISSDDQTISSLPFDLPIRKFPNTKISF